MLAAAAIGSCRVDRKIRCTGSAMTAVDATKASMGSPVGLFQDRLRKSSAACSDETGWYDAVLVRGALRSIWAICRCSSGFPAALAFECVVGHQDLVANAHEGHQTRLRERTGTSVNRETDSWVGGTSAWFACASPFRKVICLSSLLSCFFASRDHGLFCTTDSACPTSSLAKEATLVPKSPPIVVVVSNAVWSF